jgi:Predicted nucleoside-diphosphate sugar epimerases
MNYWKRIVLLMAVDVILVNLSVYISLLLRFDGKIEPLFLKNFWALIPWYSIISLIILSLFKIYKRLWEYASLDEVISIIKAISVSTLAVVLCIYSLHLPHLPRSVYIISGILTVIFIGGARLGWRMIRNLVIQDFSSVAKKALIIGAGDAGAMVARELSNNKALNLMPVGFIDDSEMKQHMTVYGIPILGNRYNIPQIVERHRIDEIIFAIPSASGSAFREIIEICRETSSKLSIFQGGGGVAKQKPKASGN